MGRLDKIGNKWCIVNTSNEVVGRCFVSRSVAEEELRKAKRSARCRSMGGCPLKQEFAVNDLIPTKLWWDTCNAKVGGTDTNKVCGAIWSRIEPIIKKRIRDAKEPFKQCHSMICYEQKLNLKEIIPMAKEIMRQSIKCVEKFPSMETHPTACEVGILPTLEQNATLHTHTDPDIDYPSGVDINTTKQLGKKFLCVANSGNGNLICYDSKDDFQSEIFRRKLL